MGLTQRLGTIPLAIQTDSSNNVGIGGTPSGSFKLEVTGASKLSGFLGVNGSPATSFPFEAYINSSTAYSSTSRGNVMRVYNSNTGANVFAGIELGGAGTANDGLAGINAAVTGSGSASLNFYTRNSGTFEEKLRLDSNGQLNMSPYHSNAKFCPGADSNHYLRYLTSLDGLEMSGFSGLMFSTLGGTERMRITSGGCVAINNPTDKSQPLSIRGFADNWIAFFQASTTTNQSYGPLIYAGTSSADNALYIANATGGNLYFRIRGDGYMSSVPTYNNTYSNAANVYIGADGFMGRSTSSIKYKENVLDYSKGLAEVMQLRPVSYTSKNPNEEGQSFAGLIAEDVHDLGLTEFVQYAEDGTPDALAYQNMIALLTKAIQELNAKVTALENK